MLKSTFVALAAFGLIGGVALAGTAITAKVATPRGERERVIADGQVWVCSGDTCQANLNRKVSARSCQDLAREVGQVVAFGNLDANELARCNTQAAAPRTTAVANR